MDDEDFRNRDDAARPPHIFSPDASERNWAMACHLSAVGGYLLPYVLAQFVIPLVIWLMKRDSGAFIDAQGKETVNFQLSLLLYAVVLTLSVIGLLLLLPLVIFGFVCPIVGAVKASEGREFRYPLCIHFIK
ncbi:DUF4870 domain-containing protein [Pontiella agarivorans]|uniref:DUF4870 domain-containing protein n=1 Tax=Pontiella agarivorans TaxID=3038953 RepID=A0ABU5MT51_9BACT|nr:DUF4870 domain-containing protein [Pontiella agarivorans]MDZ8117374.1 DUF4870 domain-containing protein [Pontiella agarivorans]